MSSRRINKYLREQVEGEKKVHVRVSVSHDANRKCYFVSINKESTSGGWVKCLPFNGVLFGLEACVRYSEKRLAALAATILDDARVQAAVEQVWATETP
jgi:hypothetical protein